MKDATAKLEIGFPLNDACTLSSLVEIGFPLKDACTLSNLLPLHSKYIVSTPPTL